MSLSAEFAEKVLAFDIRSAGADLTGAAKAAIADTVGVTLLGASDTATRTILDTPGIAEAPGPCVVLGTNRRRSPPDAALINGVASHAHDFDDFTEVFGGHPSVPVLPAILAVGDICKVSGPEFIAAYVAGVEAETRLAMGVHFYHYEKGWHPTSTLGVFGAAAASARLMKLDAGQTAMALCIAVSLSSGVKANFGTMTKPLHVGHCARSGLLAAMLAARGFTANPQALEAPHGFLRVFNGDGRFDEDRMRSNWFEPAVVLSPGISVKQFPCCGSTHPAIYAALELKDAHDFDAEDISEVEIRTHPRRLPHTDNPAPDTALAAKFSMQYCVARALVSGNVSLAHFEGDSVRDPRVRRLMDRTRVVPDEVNFTDADGGNTFGAVVSIRVRGGDELESAPVRRAGRGAKDPMTESELRAKFTDCARRVLTSNRIDALWTELMRLESLPDVSVLTDLTAVGKRRRPAVAVGKG